MLSGKNLFTTVVLKCAGGRTFGPAFPQCGLMSARYNSTLTLHGVTDSYAKALEKAGEAFKEAESIFNDPAYCKHQGWKKDTTNDWGDAVYAKQTEKGKMVAISTDIEGDPEFVMKDIWKRVEGLPTWSEQVDYTEVVARPSENFDIIAYGKDGNVLVSGRDFVTARIYRKIKDGYIMASKSVEVAEHPKPKDMERAELHLAAARLVPHPKRQGYSQCDVVMLTDLKGMLPKMIVNKALGKMMLRDAEENQTHFHDLKEKNA